MVDGKVTGGHFVGATIMLDRKGQLTVTNTGQVKLDLGFKKSPRLDVDTVAKWEEVVAGGNGGAALAIGQAIAGVALPGIVGKMASSALGATGGTAKLRPRTVRIDWADGNQSVVELPEKLFTHLALVLASRKAEPTPEPSTVVMVTPPAAPDVMEQLAKLATLQDQGVLTEEEFTKTKADLLSRL